MQADLSSQIEQHVATIARHEQDFLASRSPAEKLADRVASFAGKIAFVILHLVFFAAWVLLNTLPATVHWHFDPFPYAFLDTIVALEAILLASFILMRQTSLARRADEREHMALQILLLTEKEVSAVIRINQRIADQMGLKDIARDPEIRAFAKPTEIDDVAQTIQEKLSIEELG